MMSGGGVVKVDLFHRTLGLFCEAWKVRYGKPYRPTKADRNQLGRALHELEREDWPDIPVAIQNYLADLTQWVSLTHRHSLMCFCNSGGFNKYRVRPPVLSDKEARTMETLRNWEERANGAHK